MIAIDTNILVAAHRGEHPLHEVALSRLVALAEGDNAWALPVFCLGEFLRVVTHPRIFTPPSSLDVAGEFLDRLCQSPSIRLLIPGPGFLKYLLQAAKTASATGNLAFDAQIAALCKEAGIDGILTEDRDFARFEGLRTERLVH